MLDKTHLNRWKKIIEKGGVLIGWKSLRSDPLIGWKSLRSDPLIGWKSRRSDPLIGWKSRRSDPLIHYATFPTDKRNEHYEHYEQLREKPAGNYIFNVNNRNIRARCEICSKLKRKTPERRHWRRSGVYC